MHTTLGSPPAYSGEFYFIGIGGIGMSALANILLDRGLSVSGSDLAASYVTEMLVKAGAKVHVGHAKENIKPGMTVVYTTGMTETNPEFSEARRLGCPLLHRSDLLSQIAVDFKLFAITGTHGKTTTSALLSQVLIAGGREPAFAIGGVLPAYGRNGGNGKENFVIEACESDGTFLKYSPYGAIVTNIDNDHLDYFGSEKDLKQAFFKFIDNVACSDLLFWCGDDPHLKQHSPLGISYGFEKECSLRLSNFSQKDWTIHFDIHFKEINYKNIYVPLTGRHNALNAGAVFGFALALGLEEEVIRQGLASFKGIKRRCECKGEYQGCLFIDDYAHHPVEIKTTLEGIRMAIGPDRPLLAIYQPHRYTRTRDCLGLFAHVFDVADKVILTNIYGAGEAPIAGITDQKVLDDLLSSVGVPLQFIPYESLLDYLGSHLPSKGVIVTLGAGDITQIGSLFLKRHQKAIQ